MRSRLPSLLLLALLLPSTASARRVFQVGPSRAITTIGEALALADPGDRLLLAAGTYSECLTLPAGAFEIVGESGAAQTTIDCGGSQAFAISGSNVQLRLEGLTIANPSNQGVGVLGGSLVGRDLIFDGLGASDAQGGAIHATGAEVRLHSVRFTDCTAEQGGAIYASDSLVHVQAGTFAGNGATHGGALYLDQCDGSLVESTFDSNTATQDGGSIWAFSEFDGATSESIGVLAMQQSTFTTGSAGGSGGFVHVSGNGTIAGAIGSSFTGGTASVAGGAIYSSAESLAAFGATLSGNSAPAGGAIAGDGVQFEAEDTRFTDNRATAGDGGAIWWPGTLASPSGDSRVVVEGGLIQTSTATGDGGALWSGLPTRLRGAALTDNTAGGSGGGAYLSLLDTSFTDTGEVDDSQILRNTAGASGGGVHVAAGPSLSVIDSLFADNAASLGGGMRVEAGASVSPIQRTSFDRNAATDAGGGLAIDGGTTSLFAAWFYENTSDGRGGGLLLDAGGSVSASRLTVVSNQASEGGGAWVGGGSSLDLSDSSLATNQAGNGGAVAAIGGVLGATRAWFCGNVATGLGSAYYADELLPGGRIASSAFADNLGGGAIHLASTGGARGISALSLTQSSFAGNADVGAFVVDGAPASGSTPFSSSFATLYQANTSAALVTLNATTGSAISSSSDIFQDHVDDVVPGGTAANSFNIDGQAALFPFWTSGDACAADLTPERIYTTTPYQSRVGSADQLFTDPDGDGISFAAGDCRPNDSTVYPGATEIDGDGIDQDCDAYDGNDADGDGVIDSVDCNDANPAIPGAEGWYDTVDEDCLELSEFDQDLDRFEVFVPVDYETTAFPYGIFAFDDCLDTDAEAYPGGLETWYDSIDSDCDGLNDFDQDFDTYVRAGFDIQAGGSATNTGDCDDRRGDVYPGAPDDWYDGVDSDCGGENDFDQDGDGYIIEGAEGNEGNLGTGDCDDTDPNVHPGMTEDLGNGIDDNCDGFTDIDATTDTDSDGIPDVYEAQYGTNPNEADSDSDGIPDGEEWHDDCDTYTLDDPPADSDGDTVIDALDEDSDDDGRADADESTGDTDGDCLADFRDDDDDDDGLLTSEEDAGGTDALNPDTDNDNVPDAVDPAPLSNGAGGVEAPSPVADYGCGCRTGGPAPAGVLLLPLLLGLRRRR